MNSMIFTVLLMLLGGVASLKMSLRGGMRRMSLRMADKHYDYVVVGGGSGGMASARRAASHGASVAVIEQARMGGTCVNVGCVPKKVMWNAATVNEMIHEAHNFGFKGATEGLSFDWALMKELRDAYILRLNGIYDRNLDNSKVDVFKGAASFSGAADKEVIVTAADGSTQSVSGSHVLVAVGGRPHMPDIPGVEHCIDSNGFFALPEQPKRVAVIGGGYIGVELAGVFHALGSKTQLVLRGDKPLRGFDDLIVDTLVSEMGKQGLPLVTQTSPTAVIKNEQDKTLMLQTNKGELGPFDAVLFATGRVPLTEGLGLDKVGVTTTNRGLIQVDTMQCTNREGVYAVGDVSSSIQLTPTAIAAGRRLADRLFNNKPKSCADYNLVPTVVFSHPCIGTVGLTEVQAREKYGNDDIKVYQSTFTNLWYGPWQGIAPTDKPKTSMKLVCRGPEETVVGAHSIGMGSDELLQGFAIAMKMGATKADFDDSVAIHPTAAEEMVTMGTWGTAPSEKYGY